MILAITVDVSKVVSAFKRFPEEMSAIIRVEMRNQMASVQEHARTFHRFTTRTSMLERSILQNVSQSGLAGEVYLNKGIAPYGLFVHQGHGSWRSDQFVYMAFAVKAQQIVRALQKAITDALIRVGLK